MSGLRGWLPGIFLVSILALPSGPIAAGERAATVLIVDLDGDGLQLSDRYYPVRFDLDGDGELEETSWTAQGENEAFLWLDRNDNGRVDDGSELFGGEVADDRNMSGFELLHHYDQKSAGGNGDGKLSQKDEVWRELRLWIDRDHDGVSDPGELSDLEAWRLREIELSCGSEPRLNGNLNLHVCWSRLSRSARSGEGRKRFETRVTEVMFDPAP